jgi:hypothetical protein
MDVVRHDTPGKKLRLPDCSQMLEQVYRIFRQFSMCEKPWMPQMCTDRNEEGIIGEIG